MGRLIYSAIASLDGYVVDRDGNFDWAEPDEEVHAFVNDRMRAADVHLYGRRMYDVMVWWETIDTSDSQPAVLRDFAAVWRAADKVVYSTTLEDVTTARTRLERSFEPDDVRRLKESVDGDLTIGGAELAAHALRAGLVDEVELFVNPIIVGGGTHWLPDGVRIPLELVSTRRFGNGVVHLHHRVVAPVQ